ncbi:MAG: SpoIIE family protein phosphatase, partial [Candidatus Heimdallarchaeota archaeon]|nr:SpoIIE family protein phosphatase [Candidatus Heimdallarchaeota archaeon]
RYVSGGGCGFLVSGKENTTFAKRDSFLGLRYRPFHEYELPFKKGDILALYTDGMIEAQNTEKEDYTVSRLNKMITDNAKKPIKDILEICKQDYQNFRSHDSDDITLIIMRKKV